MQLLILLALLLGGAGGNMDAGNLLDKARPVIEALGGANAQNALKQAEDLTKIFSGFSGGAGAGNGGGNANSGGRGMCGGNANSGGKNYSNGGINDSDNKKGGNGGKNNGGGNGAGYKFPLAPVANIMDKNITYCLSRYLSESLSV